MTNPIEPTSASKGPSQADLESMMAGLPSNIQHILHQLLSQLQTLEANPGKLDSSKFLSKLADKGVDLNTLMEQLPGKIAQFKNTHHLDSGTQNTLNDLGITGDKINNLLNSADYQSLGAAFTAAQTNKDFSDLKEKLQELNPGEGSGLASLIAQLKSAAQGLNP